MKVVLLEDVSKVGKKFQVKDVANGYARNYLLPRNLAALAESAMLKRVEQLKQKYETERVRQLNEIKELASQLADKIITIEAKANEQGHLFRGINQLSIAKAVLKQIKIELKPEWIELAQSIKAVGEYKIPVRAESATSQIKLVVKAA